MNIRVFCASLAFLIAIEFFAQDPLFTNSLQSLIYLNPSFAGSNGGVRAQSLYRSQMPIADSYYKTFNSSVDFYLKGINAGMAVTYQNDNTNKKTLLGNTFTYSYAQYISLVGGDLKIIPSLQAGYVYRTLSVNQLRFGSTPTIYVVGPSQTKFFLDLSSGLLINYRKIYVGASVFHFNQPNIGFFGEQILPARLSIYSSVNQRLNVCTVANLTVRYEHQNTFDCLYLNLNAITAGRILFGLGYNSKNTANANIGYRNNFFMLSLDYESWLNAPKEQLRDTWEFSLSINIRDKVHRKSITNLEAQ